MEEITLYDLSPTEILEVVYCLKNSGWNLGVDFEFSYSPSKSYYADGEYVTTRKYATFKFTKEENATWFALKYGE